MSDNTFCTMGGMMGHNHMNMPIEMQQHRKLSQSKNKDDYSWDSEDLPVILDDDNISGDDKKHGQKDTHSHHGHKGSNIDNHNQQHSSSSRNMSNMSGGTVMYMDGFHSSLFPPSSAPPPPCLNMFHPSWTLDTPTRFVFGMIFVTLLGMLVEACGVWRVKCLRKGRNIRRDIKLRRMRAWEEYQQRMQTGQDMQGQQLEFREQSQRLLQSGVSDISDVSSVGSPSPSVTNATSTISPICPAIVSRVWRTNVPKFIRSLCAKLCCCFFARTGNGRKSARHYDLAAACLHASRAWLGYLLMLAVMSYSVELLASAVLGMVLGRYYFVGKEASAGSGQGGGGVMSGAVGVGGGIGGMGLGDGGGGRQSSAQGVGMTQIEGNDGTWGGGDPCCGVDDHDEDNNHDFVGDSLRIDNIREPLLSSIGNNAGVTRRSGVSMHTEETP